MRPKTYTLLRHFLDNPGRLLSRNELIGALWPGLAVTDDSLTQCIRELRQALGDRAAYILRTVPKRGYMLVAEVRREATSCSETDPVTTPIAPSRNLSDFRSETMAVHRFETLDGDRICISLANGLTTDLIAALTCFEGLRVLPVTATMLQAAYCVRGEVRAVGQDLHVTVRLEDVGTGTALWAKRFVQASESSPELPTADMTTLVVHLCQQVDRHCLGVARRKPMAMLSARELHLVGRDHHQRATETDIQSAKEMFSLAIAADPDYAQAYAWQAYTLHRAASSDWGGPREHLVCDEALRLAQRGVQIDPTSPLCLSRLAYALMLHGQWEDAVATAHAALISDRPAFTAARNPCCEVLTHAGHPEEAATIARGTLALDPLRPPITHALLGRALLLAGRVEDALPHLRLCASRLPDYAPAYDSLIVAASESGQVAEARAAWRELARLAPGWMPCNRTGLWFFRRLEDLDRFEAAYRRVAVGQADIVPVRSLRPEAR